MKLAVYLAGEIHSNWRAQIVRGISDNDLPIQILGPVTDHGASDEVGATVLGFEAESFWKDHKAAKINAIRIKTLIEKSDIVVVKFGEKYRQWNAAFDAGYAVAKGKSLITLHPPEFNHALKEVDAAALAVAKTADQVVEILQYITMKE
jgi:YtoQ family protein